MINENKAYRLFHHLIELRVHQIVIQSDYHILNVLPYPNPGLILVSFQSPLRRIFGYYQHPVFFPQSRLIQHPISRQLKTMISRKSCFFRCSLNIYKHEQMIVDNVTQFLYHAEVNRTRVEFYPHPIFCKVFLTHGKMDQDNGSDRNSLPLGRLGMSQW